jgi:hypothetical protein
MQTQFQELLYRVSSVRKDIERKRVIRRKNSRSPTPSRRSPTLSPPPSKMRSPATARSIRKSTYYDDMQTERLNMLKSTSVMRSIYDNEDANLPRTREELLLHYSRNSGLLSSVYRQSYYMLPSYKLDAAELLVDRIRKFLKKHLVIWKKNARAIRNAENQLMHSHASSLQISVNSHNSQRSIIRTPSRMRRSELASSIRGPLQALDRDEYFNWETDFGEEVSFKDTTNPVEAREISSIYESSNARDRGLNTLPLSNVTSPRVHSQFEFGGSDEGDKLSEEIETPRPFQNFRQFDRPPRKRPNLRMSQDSISEESLEVHRREIPNFEFRNKSLLDEGSKTDRVMPSSYRAKNNRSIAAKDRYKTESSPENIPAKEESKRGFDSIPQSMSFRNRQKSNQEDEGTEYNNRFRRDHGSGSRTEQDMPEPKPFYSRRIPTKTHSSINFSAKPSDRWDLKRAELSPNSSFSSRQDARTRSETSPENPLKTSREQREQNLQYSERSPQNPILYSQESFKSRPSPDKMTLSEFSMTHAKSPTSRIETSRRFEKLGSPIISSSPIAPRKEKSPSSYLQASRVLSIPTSKASVSKPSFENLKHSRRFSGYQESEDRYTDSSKDSRSHMRTHSSRKAVPNLHIDIPKDSKRIPTSPREKSPGIIPGDLSPIRPENILETPKGHGFIKIVVAVSMIMKRYKLKVWRHVLDAYRRTITAQTIGFYIQKAYARQLRLFFSSEFFSTPMEDIENFRKKQSSCISLERIHRRYQTACTFKVFKEKIISVFLKDLLILAFNNITSVIRRHKLNHFTTMKHRIGVINELRSIENHKKFTQRSLHRLAGILQVKVDAKVLYAYSALKDNLMNIRNKTNAIKVLMRNINKDVQYRLGVCLRYWHYVSRQSEFDSLRTLAITQIIEDLIHRNMKAFMSNLRIAKRKSRAISSEKQYKLEKCMKIFLRQAFNRKYKMWSVWKYNRLPIEISETKRRATAQISYLVSMKLKMIKSQAFNCLFKKSLMEMRRRLSISSSQLERSCTVRDMD